MSVLGSTCLVGGDFNAPRNANTAGIGVHPPIDSWGQENGLIHVFSQLSIAAKPTYYSGSQPKHEIDHILCTLSPLCVPTHGYVLDDDGWAQETDHRPVAADFHIPGFRLRHTPRWKRRRRRAKIIDISRSNPHEVSLFQAAMRKRHNNSRPPDTMTTDELHRKLQRIHADTYKVAEKICSSPRRKSGNWTPHMVALRCRQGALLSIARITRTMSRSPQCLHQQITRACRRWSTTLQSLSQTADEADEWGSYLGKGPSYWSSLPPWEANAEVDAAIRQTRRSLNGRKSTERRQRFLDTKLKRQEKRTAGKHLSEIKSLIGEAPSGSLLDVLEEQGQRIIDPHDIATHTTEFFRE
jgi:hypothetical protein